MRKSWIALALSGILLFSGVVPAAAAEEGENKNSIENTSSTGSSNTDAGTSENTDPQVEEEIGQPSDPGVSNETPAGDLPGESGTDQSTTDEETAGSTTEDPSSAGADSTSGDSSASNADSTSGNSSASSADSSSGSSSASSADSSSGNSSASTADSATGDSSSSKSDSTSSSATSQNKEGTSSNTSTGSSTSSSQEEKHTNSISENSADSASSSSSTSGSEEKPEGEEEALPIVSFDKIATITVEGGTGLKEVLRRLPTVVKATLSDGSKIKIPVDWRCEGDYNGELEGYFTFDAVVKTTVDGTKYEIGHELAPDVRFPNAIVRVLAIVPPGETIATVVMDDVTGASIAPIDGEKAVFEFLVKKLGLNYAAACGVMANIVYESNFNPHAIGDGGTSYGICQWHLGRYTALVRFCEKNKLSYGSMEGQLRYLQYELKNGYEHVLEYLRSVPNTEEGAFQAGYYWCFHFERPAYIYDQSNLRGNAAKNSYWPRYRNYQFKSWRRIQRQQDMMVAMEV